MAKFEAVVYFRTSDMEVIRKIQRHFGMEEKITVNYECPVRLDDDELVKVLREVEERGFIDIRRIPLFEFPKT